MSARTAERILSRTFGRPIEIGCTESLGVNSRSQVLRCHVVDPPRGVPPTVIAKCFRADDGQPYSPIARCQGDPAWRFNHEWAGSAFLSRVLGPRCYSPCLYGSDSKRGILILEDLGSGNSLADVLAADDSSGAKAALQWFARALGQMHAATIRREWDYRQLCSEIGADVAGHASERWLGRLSPQEHTERFVQAATVIGAAITPDVEREIDKVVAAIQEPGPFLAFVNADVCPVNNVLTEGGIRLLDFEFGGFRHALLAHPTVLFPTTACAGRIPGPVLDAVGTEYRKELATGCPEALEDRLFSAAVTTAHAYWMIWLTSWHLLRTLQSDEQDSVSATRQRLLTRLDAFASTTQQLQCFEAFGAAAGKIARQLRCLWPARAHELPVYAVFGERPKVRG